MSVQVSERRREPRLGIRLPARISLAGEIFDGFEIRDYCSGGLLLVAASDLRAPLPAVGTMIGIGVILGAGEDARRLRLNARVAHQMDNGIGAAFTEPKPKILRLFRSVAQNRARIDDGGTRKSSPVAPLDEARLQAVTIRAGKTAFTEIFQQLLQRFDGALHERAASAGTWGGEIDILGDLGELRAIDDEVTVMMRALVDRVLGKGRPDDFDAMDAAELKLLEDDDFESWLTASRAVTRLEDRYSSELENLRGALRSHQEGQRMFGGEAPFSPTQVAEVLTGFADRNRLSKASRVILFDTAAEILATRLGPVYDSLVASFASNGLKAQAAKPRQRHEGRSHAESASHAASAHGGGPPISELLSRELPQGQRLDVVDLLAALPRMGSSSELDFDALLGQLRAAADTGHTFVAKTEERTRFAGDLIEHLRADDSLVSHAAGVLGDLQLPVLREALADRQFFRDRQHPLREILDQIGHLALFLESFGQAQSESGIGDALNDIFDDLVDVDDGDREGYEQIAQAVGRLADTESDKFQRNVERVVESCTGRERLLRTRVAVIEEINGRYAGKSLPVEASELLTVGWRAQLELTHLRTNGGKAYGRDLDTLDDLVRQLDGDAFGITDAVRDPVELHGEIRTTLESSAFDPFRKMRLLDRIYARLVHHDPGEQEIFEPLELPPEARDHVSTPDDIDRQAWIRALEAVERFEIGESVILTCDDREQTLRLAWRSEDKSHFTFVDSQGLRAADLKRSELARQVHDHEVKLVPADPRPLTERAVDNLMEDMGRRLNDQVVNDSLTGLKTRRSFVSLLERCATTNETEFDPFVLLWLNLDHFRVVNESASFEAGDALLAEVSKILVHQCPDDAAIGYLGGDSFGILLHGECQAAGLTAAETIRGLIEEHAFVWGKRKYRITARIGVLEVTEPTDQPTRILRAADASLDAARQAGGNRVYSYALEDEAIARQVSAVQWIARVDDALDSGELRLRCQKIVPVSADSNHHIHHEVLLGVRGSNGADLNIGEFITAAENANRMPRVDRWIAETAIRWLGLHADRIDDIGGLAINLSGQTVNDESFVVFVRNLLRETGVDASRISFEVTETATIANLARTSRIIRAIKHLGCRVALDDFGSGLASYTYLKELPVDTLKIDGIFVKGMATNSNDFAVVKSINEIGHFMGLETIAEFVTDGDILRKLREIGVDYAQGFGIERPHLLDDLI